MSGFGEVPFLFVRADCYAAGCGWRAPGAWSADRWTAARWRREAREAAAVHVAATGHRVRLVEADDWHGRSTWRDVVPAARRAPEATLTAAAGATDGTDTPRGYDTGSVDSMDVLTLPVFGDDNLARFAVEVGIAVGEAAQELPPDAPLEDAARALVDVLGTAATRAGLDPGDVLRVAAFGLRRRRAMAGAR